MNFTLTNLSPGVYGRNKQQVYASNIIKYNEGLSEIEIDERFSVYIYDLIDTETVCVKLLNDIIFGHLGEYKIGSRIVMVEAYAEYELIEIAENDENNTWSYKLLNVVKKEQ